MYNVIYYILQANSNVLSEVAAPAWLHRYIIGRKGANIQFVHYFDHGYLEEEK
jgi:hypothetical protein